MEEILFLSHRLPFPPAKGCRIRAFHLLRALAERYRVHLLTFADDGQVAADWAPLAALCETLHVVPLPRRRAYLRCAANAWRPRPFTLSYFRSGRLERRVRELCARRPVAAVVAYSTAMVPFALAAGRVPKLLDMVDVDSAKWGQYARSGPWPWRPVHAVEASRMRAFEAAAVGAFGCVTLASERDRGELAGFAAHPSIRTVPNGVDLDYFRPAEAPPGPPALAFTGQMDYLPNVDAVVRFARQSLPALRRRFPDLELLVVGRSPAPTVRALAELPGVTVTGEVDDVRPYLARASVFVAPLVIAQGVQNKVLEAMASGLPVVCTPKVVAGLAGGSIVPGDDLVVAEVGAGFRDAVAGLLASPDGRRRIGANGRRAVLAGHSWDQCGERLRELLAGVVAAGRGDGPEARVAAGAPPVAGVAGGVARA